MVDYYGRWTPEEDYSSFPEEKMTDCDRIAKRIIEDGYEPKTSLEHLVDMIVLICDCPDMEDELDRDNIDTWWAYIEASGGYAEFDYYA